MVSIPSYTIAPLGDTAIRIDFGNKIDQAVHCRIMALYDHLKAFPFKGTTDLIPAYSSLTVCYEPAAYLQELNAQQSIAELLTRQLTEIAETTAVIHTVSPRLIKLPVCYEGKFAPDLSTMAATTGKTEQTIINLHTETIYQVYMLGFLPGFAYMGEVDDVIAMPRKSRPVPIAAGSVGIAGKQTGVYPLASPGGWNIVGRTPLSLFNRETGGTLFQPGDHVQFYSISSDEFERY